MPQYHSTEDYNMFTNLGYMQSTPAVTSDLDMSDLQQPNQPRFESWNSSVCDFAVDQTRSYDYSLDYVAIPHGFEYAAVAADRAGSRSCPPPHTDRTSTTPVSSPSARTSDGEERYQRRRQQNRTA